MGQVLLKAFMSITERIPNQGTALTEAPATPSDAASLQSRRTSADNTEYVLRNLSDSHLVRDAQVGNSAALAELWKRYKSRLYKYIYFRTRDADCAYDILSEISLKLVLGIRQYKGDKIPFSAWLFRVTANACADYFRRANRGDVASFDQPLLASSSLALGEITPDDNPKDTLEALFRSADLKEALDTLTVDQRQVLYLKFVEGRSNLEIAERLGKPEGAIKSLQHRAIVSLRRILSEAGEVDDHLGYINDRPSEGVDFSLQVALLRYPRHYLHEGLRHPKEPERGEELRDLVEQHLIPFIDNGLHDPMDKGDLPTDSQTDSVHRRALYRLVVDEMSMKHLAEELDLTVEETHTVIALARQRVVDYLTESTGKSFREIYDLLRGTGWLFAVSSAIRTNLAPLSEPVVHERRTPRPRQTFHIRLSGKQLRTLGGCDGYDSTQSRRDESSIDEAIHHSQRFWESTLPMRMQRGQSLQPRDGACVLVHQKRIAATSRVANGELAHYGIPRVFRPNHMPLVISGKPLRSLPEYFPDGGVALDDCVISLVHPEAGKLTDLDKQSFQVAAEEHRDALKRLYADLKPVSARAHRVIPKERIMLRAQMLLTGSTQGPKPTDMALFEAAFAELSPRDKALLRLTFADKLDDKEIARRLRFRKHGKLSKFSVEDARNTAYELLYNYMLALGEQS